MEKRWNLYLSTIEIEIIEKKLDDIINSLTFKYSRQPEMLSLIPDQLVENNIKISSTIKLHINQNDDLYSDEKEDEKSVFYRDVYNDFKRAETLEQLVGSVLYAIQNENLKQQKQRTYFKNFMYSIKNLDSETVKKKMKY